MQINLNRFPKAVIKTNNAKGIFQTDKERRKKGTPILVITSHYIVKSLINLLTHIKNIS